MGDYWNKIRKQFPAVEKFTYLNSASESPTFIEARKQARNIMIKS